MRLSKIKLSGFKSFVDSTTIAFPRNLLGIVGPNGCGKSNIIDAIRWVLGEGSAKTLRGDSMVDVIFNGSSARSPVGQASIELTFDNSDGTLGGAYAGYSEVAIRRVVSRDGSSQYYLNNSRCRRKDITQILLGTGLGSHGYSIIEQGTISRLVEAKPDDMRAFLEEAAGISKYKERRRETANRIKHTRDNLARLSDVREEVDKQLGHLQRQARAASRYKDLKSEQRKIEAELLVLRILEFEAQIDEEENHCAEKQKDYDAALAHQRSTESKIEELRVDHSELNDEFNEVQGRYYKVGAEIARIEQSIQHRKELNTRQIQDLDATAKQLEEMQTHVDSDTGQIEEIDRLLHELSPELEQAYIGQEQAQNLLKEAEHRSENWRIKYQEICDELARLEGTRKLDVANAEHLENQIERLVSERDSNRKERSEIQIDEMESHLSALIKKEEVSQLAKRKSESTLDSVWKEISILQEQDRNLSENLEVLGGKLNTNRGRLASLEALQEVALGKESEQLGRWLVSRDLQSKPRLAENMMVSPGWERAIETVLGGYLNAICIDTIEPLMGSLAEISDSELVLLDQVNSDEPSSDKEKKTLSQFVSSSAAAKLVSNVLVADSVDEAMSIRKTLRPHESVITSDGIWLGPDWLRINGLENDQLGMISRGEEIKELINLIEKQTQEKEKIQENLHLTRKTLKDLEQDRVKSQNDVSKHQENFSNVKADLDSARANLEQSFLRAAALDSRFEEIDKESVNLESTIISSKDEKTKTDQQISQLQLDKQQLEQKVVEHKLVVDQARKNAEEERDRVQQIAVEVESRKSSKKSAAAALERVKNQLEHLQGRHEEIQSQLNETKNPITEEAELLEEKLKERISVETQLGEARKLVESSDEKLRNADQLRLDQEEFVQTAREKLDEVRLRIREIEVRAEAISDQLRNTGFERDLIISDLEKEATVENWEAAAEKMTRRIQRLGAINLAAIDEFKEQSERKEYLDSQFSDLTQALETLESAIRKIDRETRSRFKDTFDAANEGLGKLFPRLFGGGHAYLELEGEDLLSAGVTIMARPPGKRISTIHLLSGGEKALTAVALIFSIFGLNPAPFCLLDEVDAPLDDANVGRFSEIVKEMSEQVQFVLITHNKTTMEAMHQLIGVTMNEPGVSRLVSVDIDEAVELATM
tara:strand:+ start:5637 stop:9143 length:3507 start_codon:yes stop_codon:yes gene_type:complete